MCASGLHIALSGSNGFVGKATKQALETAGHRCLTLQRSNDSELAEDAVGWDPSDGLADPNALNGLDSVIHLAGKSIASGLWTESTRRAIEDSRVKATRRLAEQIANLPDPPSSFLCASAVGYYGDRGDHPISESTSAGRGFLPSVAQGWEAACQPLTEAGVRVINMRFGLILDPTGGTLGAMLPVYRFGLGGPIGNGQQYWPWISLNDCVRAILFLLTNEAVRGPVNFVSPDAVTNQQFSDALAAALSRPAFLRVPRFAIRTVLRSMADELLLASCRAIPEALLTHHFQFEDPDLRDYLVQSLGQ